MIILKFLKIKEVANKVKNVVVLGGGLVGIDALAGIIDYDIKYTEFKRDIIDIVIRIIIGVLLIGPIGILAGFTANKSFISYRLISIEFKNGNKSLVKIDNRTFKYLVEKVY